MKLKPYPEYKDARITWLEKIPAHWQEKRAKFLFREIDERSSSGEEELLSVSHITGVTPRSQKNVTMFKAESYVGHKVCQPGDIVINTMWAWMAALGVAKHTGIVSPSYGVYRPRDQQNFLPEYIDQVLRTWGFVAEYNTRSTGIRSSRLRLYPDQFLDISMPVPPIEEQQKMIDYLKFENRKINRFIRNKRSLIRLLNEQKKIIINHAVTRGLTSNISLKPSGITDIGDIPIHWEVKRGKHLFTVVDERSETGTEELLSVSHITGVTPRSLKNIYMFQAQSYVGYKLCYPGDIAVNTMWAWMSALGVSSYFGIISSSYHTYRQKKPYFLNQYLDFLLRIEQYRSQYLVNSQGITSSRLRLYPEDFLNIRFVVPSIDEQAQILDFIERETLDINTIISRAQHEIELIQEYRTRLISDVVTGKIDVRDIEIPALPYEDVIEELEDEDLLEEAEAELEEDGNTDE